MEEAFTEIVKPALAKVRPDGPMYVSASSIDLSANALQRLRSKKGIPCQFGMTAYMTSDGPRVTFTDVLESAWILEGSLRMGRLLAGFEVRQAVLDGIRRDRNKLERAGIRAIVRQGPEGKPLSFDDFEKHLEMKIADSKSRMPSP